MEQHSDSTFADLGENTALVCIDHQQYQKIIVPQLIDMTYKVHLGLFAEDVLLKLKAYAYSVVATLFPGIFPASTAFFNSRSR